MGGDRVSHALWRSGKGRAVKALGAVASKDTSVIILLGLNDVTALGKASDVVGGVCKLVSELKAGINSDVTRVFVLEVPLLPRYSPEMRKLAKNINKWLGKVGARVGFTVPKYTSLLDEHGTVMPGWLISRRDVHLNAGGYRVFARFLGSLIIQGSYSIKFSWIG